MAVLPPSKNSPPEIAGLQTLIKAGELDQARQQVRQHEDFVPVTEADWLVYQGLLEKLEMFAQDEIMTAKFLKACPESWKARLVHTSYLMKSRRQKQAQAEIDFRVENPVHEPEFWNQLVEIIWRLQNWNQLIEVADTGLRLTPGRFRFHFAHAAALWFLQRPREAVIALDKCLDYANGGIIPCFDVIKFADRCRVPGAAATALNRALQFAAADPSCKAWAQMVPLLKAHFSPPRTEHFFATALAAKIPNPEALAKVFDYASTAANPPIALALGRQLMALNPTLPDLPARLAKLETAQAPSSDSWWQALKPAIKP